jgi:hypothetical protein
MRSSLYYDVILRILEVSYVSGQPSGPIFKCQAAQGHSSWTALSLSKLLRVYTETSVTTNQRCVTSQKSENLIYTGQED